MNTNIKIRLINLNNFRRVGLELYSGRVLVKGMADIFVSFNSKILKKEIIKLHKFTEISKKIKKIKKTISFVIAKQVDKYFKIWWNFDIIHANLNVKIINTFQQWHMNYSSYTYYDFMYSVGLIKK